MQYSGEWIAMQLARGLGVPVLVQDRETAQTAYPAFVYRMWPDGDRTDPLVFDVPVRTLCMPKAVVERYTRFRLTLAKKALGLTP